MFEGREIKIGKTLSEAVRHDLLAVIAEFRDIFTFSVEEMAGIPPEVICHKLDIKPGYKPVKQKLWHQGKERIEAAKEEVTKLLKAGFIRECQYSEWLSNEVLVKKPNGKWRMCVDFTDLNKACPKDDYPLPKIDRLWIPRRDMISSALWTPMLAITKSLWHWKINPIPLSLQMSGYTVTKSCHLG
jgi:hypothetical protein